jgi:rhodanese-related sulfurtransferase
MNTTLTCAELYAQIGLPDAPVLIDVRGPTHFEQDRRLIPGSIRADAEHPAEWVAMLPRARAIAVYCAAGRERSAGVTHALSTLGINAMILSGGFAEWTRNGYPTVTARSELNAPGASRWVTRERPKIDRLACPWLIRRFIDPNALFFYVPAHRVRLDAPALGAEPYDITEVRFSHRGSACSFDAFLDEFELHDPVIDAVASIVRAADTGSLENSPQAPGLLAISLGMSANVTDDILLLEQAMPMYDALYAWCKKARSETHSWPQQAA